MTCILVLYDRVSANGVFVKGGGVKVSECIRILTKEGGECGEQLKSCLKYSTTTFDSESTPSRVRRALGD